MAYGKSFGEMLRAQRVALGLTYSTVSRELKIRPDVIQALEDEDFSIIPSRQYAKGMIRAYSTFLHLNPEPVLRSYDEALETRGYETSSRSSRRSRGADGQARGESRRGEGRGSRSTRSSRSLEEPRSARGASRGERGQSRGGRASSRDSLDVRDTRRSRGDSRQASSSARGGGGLGVSMPRRRKADFRQSVYDSPHNNLLEPFDRHASSERGAVVGGNYVGTYEKRSTRSFKKILLIVGVIVIVILLVLAVRALIGAFSGGSDSASNSTANSTNVTISGLNDPGDAGTVEEEHKVIPIAPTAAVFSYSVADGESAYIEIYLDDSETPSVATVIDGPARDSYDVADTLFFVTARPSAVTAKVDGKDIELEDDDGDGIYTYTVDFNEILAEWKVANGVE